MQAVIIFVLYVLHFTNGKVAGIIEHNFTKFKSETDGREDPYEGWLFDNKTQIYYLEALLPVSCGGIFMKEYKDPQNPKNAICTCKKEAFCIGRPLLYWRPTERCYYEYEQGPCKENEWLVSSNESEDGECQKTPCPPNIPTNDGLYGYNRINLDYYFLKDGQCYRTNTSAFCEKSEVAFFIGTLREPKCFNKGDDPMCSPHSFMMASSAEKPCPPGTIIQGAGCLKIAKFSV